MALTAELSLSKAVFDAQPLPGQLFTPLKQQLRGRSKLPYATVGQMKIYLTDCLSRVSSQE